MRLEAPARLDWAEALRYMGSFEAPDEALTARLETCQAKVLAAARPVGWWARFERGQAPAGLLLDKMCIRDRKKRAPTGRKRPGKAGAEKSFGWFCSRGFTRRAHSC